MAHRHRLEHRDGKIVKVSLKSGPKIKRGRVGNLKTCNLRKSKRTKRKVLFFLPTKQASNSATFLDQADRAQKQAAEIRAKERQNAAAHLHKRGTMVNIQRKEYERYQQLDEDYGSLENERDDLQEDLEKANKTIEELRKQLGQKDVAIANAASNSCNKGKSLSSLKKRLNKDMVNTVIEWTKSTVFRNMIFVEVEDDLLEATEEVWELLGENQQAMFEKPKFIADYKDVVNNALQQARHYVQQQGYKKNKGMWILCKLSIFFQVSYPNFSYRSLILLKYMWILFRYVDCL